MQFVAIFAVLLIVIFQLFSVEANYGHKSLKIKHVWKPHSYGHGYGHGDHGYGHKLVGHSKRFQHMEHGYGHKGYGHY